jgi:hypothetical protein
MDGHVVPGQAHNAVAGELEIGIAGGVALAVPAGAVELEAVELDGQGWSAQKASTSWVVCSPSTTALKAGVGISGAVWSSCLKRRSRRLFWLLGS